MSDTCSRNKNAIHPFGSQYSVCNRAEILLVVLGGEVHSLVADCHEVDVAVHLSVLGLILQVLLYGLVGALVLVLAFQKNILHLRNTVLRALRPNEHLDCLVRKHSLVVNSDRGQLVCGPHQVQTDGQRLFRFL